ncbi:hypothetical protein K7P76_29640 [Cohnella sp. NL03-T5]|uniref:Uncharacterized protein n=1 Tax=Cohnella silvisoli TaxID=2873699 RepID=A0ABV1L1V2_9BACL|nr:hypothetical protein [Cohnella silvisoli]MCD9025961.1 hypothetical protein [Cohnella silvisoli]
MKTKTPFLKAFPKTGLDMDLRRDGKIPLTVMYIKMEQKGMEENTLRFPLIIHMVNIDIWVMIGRERFTQTLFL